MPERGHGLATGRRRLMPAAGADAAAGKAAAARTLAFAASTIGYHQRHPLHGKKRFSNSHNENARTEVDARNRYGRFPATYCGRAAWRTRPQPTSADDVPRCGDTAARGTNERRRCVRPPTCAYADMNRLKSNGAILRREFVPRDPCRTNQPWRCRASGRWNCALLAAAARGREQSEISGVQRREAVGRTQRRCSAPKP
jgi:hypothetical protein